ncbi:uncharacterized protein LOC113956781 [Corapipo altera]|uniref:uncharacterized protein LOC113956781 n=1 Tax=Corapipo altera TaxID=415028 RepID=UPI000FD66F49|nr:uncharacterized protein LOC113956781 [Corapipo altera]
MADQGPGSISSCTGHKPCCSGWGVCAHTYSITAAILKIKNALVCHVKRSALRVFSVCVLLLLFAVNSYYSPFPRGKALVPTLLPEEKVPVEAPAAESDHAGDLYPFKEFHVCNFHNKSHGCTEDACTNMHSIPRRSTKVFAKAAMAPGSADSRLSRPVLLEREAAPLQFRVTEIGQGELGAPPVLFRRRAGKYECGAPGMRVNRKSGRGAVKT